MNPFLLKRLATDIPLMSVDYFAWMLGAEPNAEIYKMAEHPLMKKFKGEMKPQITRCADGAAIVPIEGPLAFRPDPGEMLYDGVEDSRAVLSMLQECGDDKSIKGVLLRMDTPGGMVLGGVEMADEVASLRDAGKPVICHVGGMGASLGYMIASQASATYANKSALVGSIGVIATVPDYSGLLAKIGVRMETFTNSAAKFKAVGNPMVPLNQDQRAHIQAGIENIFNDFKATVLSNRPQVQAEAMQGQTYRGSMAKSVGLIDGVGNEAFAMGMLRQAMKARA